MSRVVVLGPQRDRPTIGRTLADLGIRGPVATVTAGWQEWEADDAALAEQIGPGAVNLHLYARAEAVWKADPELLAGHREMQDRLRQLRRLYNRRLSHVAQSWLDMLAEDGPADLLDPERAAALESIRSLDAHHLERISSVRDRFDAEYVPLERPAVASERADVVERLRDAEAVVVEGGHVALLYNRLRLFGLGPLLEDRTVIGCSGGAMVLGERVALFHDSPPSGPGHTEIALTGLALFRGLIPLPHGRTRLRLDDRARVARLAARFAPDRCAVLGPGTRLDWDGRAWTPVDVELLRGDGTVGPWESAA